MDDPRQSDGTAAASGLINRCKSQDYKVMALFRDQETADAVTSAPPIVRLFLEEAGFGLKVAEPSDETDDAPVVDWEMRRALVKQLSAALSNRALKKALARAASKSRFDVAAFVATVVAKDGDVDQIDQTEDAPRRRIIPRRPCELRGRGRGIRSGLRYA